MADSRNLPTYAKFLFASLSGVGATMVCFPLDLLKTQMQIIGEGQRTAHAKTIALAKHIIKHEGYLGLYAGLSASVARQASYTGVRVGAFQALIDYFSEEGKPLNAFAKCVCGVISGASGGVAGLPADVALTRMAAPPNKRRDYKHVVDAIVRMAREEGYATLFRGFTPTVVRAAIINVGQITGYGSAKQFLLKYEITHDNVYCHITSSIYAGLISTICVLPVDMAKTRIQNMKIINGKPEYAGMVDACVQVVTKEGFLSLWKGFTPQFVRNGSMFTVFFIIYENLVLLHKKYILEAKKPDNI
ncbi:hypothetical protein ILUMI_00555 [Ignelater luminosus]|uniref:Uncharacterized protein n=1 Tax=Ignelater luminosus TaxID=2038154 RepID=A0A8K0DLN7_IGNLU|nr:hypothetical protein ILUMI_00555 [Ignelater luminosus]